MKSRTTLSDEADPSAPPQRRTAVVISDTHNWHDEFILPAADLLIHCGDLTTSGSYSEIQRALRWIGAQQQFGERVVVAGNHDRLFEDRPQIARALCQNVVYLEGAAHEVAGLRLYGAPWTTGHGDWVFERSGSGVWDEVPACDLLITHGPPLGVLDRTPHSGHLGAPGLLEAVERIQPAAHVFGHIHEDHGALKRGQTLHVNASVCNHRNEPVRGGWLLTLTHAEGRWSAGAERLR